VSRFVEYLGCILDATAAWKAVEKFGVVLVNFTSSLLGFIQTRLEEQL